MELYQKLPLFLKNEYKLKYFIDNNSCIGPEDFFAYDKSINLADIKENLSINNHPISFIYLRFNVQNKMIQKLIINLIEKIIAFKREYLNIINLKITNSKLVISLPNKNGISIWDRNNDCNGLYEMFEMITKASEYFTIEITKKEYISCASYMITDKPSHYWLNNNIINYSELLICNYDESLLRELNKLNNSDKSDKSYKFPIKNKFLAYYVGYPKKYEEFINTNNVEKVTEYFRNESNDSNDSLDDKYLNYLSELSKCRYANVDKHDVNLMAELLGLGVIPIVSHNTELLDLIEGTHYLHADNKRTLSIEEETEMKNNCIEYYNNNIKSEGFMKRLINHIFVWDF